MTKDRKYRILFLRSGGHFADIEYPDGPMIAPPKAVLYLAGLFTEDKSVEVRFIDLLAYPDLKHQDYTHPPFYFGMPLEKCMARIREYEPDMVALTSTAQYFFDDEVRLLKQIKSQFPGIFQVVGGPDPTNDYETYFQALPGLDVIVREEGELPFKELVQSLRTNQDWKNIAGLCFKDKGKIRLNPAPPKITRLDDYKPDYSIIDMEHYFELNRLGFPSRAHYRHRYAHRAIDVITSRGCHYDCSFCCISLHMGQGWRPHSLEYVMEDLTLLVEKYKVRHFRFEDDHLLGNVQRFKDILRGIKDRGWKITWDTPNGIRADYIDAELLQLCRETGCTYLNLAVESGNQRILDEVIHKKLRLEKVEEAARLCYEAQIDAFAMFVVGFPGEKTSDMIETYDLGISLFRKYHLKPVLQLWRPYKNTEMDKVASGQDVLQEADVFHLHEVTGIPYTLFYGKLYKDEIDKLGFLSRTYAEYLREARTWLIRNWIRILKKKPLRLIHSLLGFVWTFIKMLFHPRKRKYYLQHEILDYLFYPFAYLRGVKA